MQSKIQNPPPQAGPLKAEKSKISAPVSTRRINRLRNAFSLTSSSLEQTNPLRGLTLIRAVSLMEATLRGEYTIPQWTLWHVEQTDPDLFALISRRTSAIMEMDWDIKVISEKSEVSSQKSVDVIPDQIGNPESLAKKQAETLRAAYERIDNLSEAIEELSLAFCRGFSILQFESSNSDSTLSATRFPDHLGAYKTWNIVRNGLDGDFYFNPEARAIYWESLGEQNRIDPANHLIYTPRVSLMRIALYKFIRQNLSQKDWDAFIEIYGLPSCFIIMPPNVPVEKETEYETAAKDAAEGGNGSLPNGSDVKFANEARGVNPFRDHLKYLQEQLILAGTGGLLTMLAEPTGIGQGATGAHEDTFKTIARGEAKKISEIFQKQFDKRILNEKFPGQPILAYFEISSKEEQDIGEIIDHALKLSQAGFTMDPAQLSEKTGYKISISSTVPAISPGPNADGDAGIRPSEKTRVYNSTLGPVGPLPDRRPPDSPAVGRLLAEARMHLAEAQEAVLQPLREELQKILASPDGDLNSKLSALRSTLPALLKKINADPATAKVLEDILSESILKGLQS